MNYTNGRETHTVERERERESNRFSINKIRFLLFSRPWVVRMINVIRYAGGVVLFYLPFRWDLLSVRRLDISFAALTVVLVIIYHYFRWTDLLLKKIISTNISWEKLIGILQKKEFFIDEKQIYPITKGENFKFVLHEKTILVNLTGQLILEDNRKINFHCFLAENLLPPLLEKLAANNFLANNIQFESKMAFSYFKSIEGLSTFFVMIVITGLTINYIFIQGQSIKQALETYRADKEREAKSNELLKDMTKPILPDENFPSFRDIGGYDDAKIALQTVAEELKKGSKIGMPRGFVLYGPPGTGKTMMAKAFAKEAGLTFFKVSGSKINSGLVAQQFGASKNKLYSLLEAAAKHTKEKKRRVVVFIDEIDMMNSEAKLAGINLNKLAGNGTGGTEFKDIMDGDDHEKFKDIIFIVTTNYLGWFDRAALRPGRLERKYFIGEPEENDLKVIVGIYVKKYENKIPSNLKSTLAEKIVKKIRDKKFVGATVNSVFENLDLARKELNKKRNLNKEENDWEVFERAIEQTIEIEETSRIHESNIFGSL
jgi:SpoVK/Ycf46/Vps4 family AAA+-type ATPase